MDYAALAELLFPQVIMTPEEVEAKFPPRGCEGHQICTESDRIRAFRRYVSGDRG